MTACNLALNLAKTLINTFSKKIIKNNNIRWMDIPVCYLATSAPLKELAPSLNHNSINKNKYLHLILLNEINN